MSQPIRPAARQRAWESSVKLGVRISVGITSLLLNVRPARDSNPNPCPPVFPGVDVPFACP